MSLSIRDNKCFPRKDRHFLLQARPLNKHVRRCKLDWLYQARSWASHLLKQFTECKATTIQYTKKGSGTRGRESMCEITLHQDQGPRRWTTGNLRPALAEDLQHPLANIMAASGRRRPYDLSQTFARSPSRASLTWSVMSSGYPSKRTVIDGMSQIRWRWNEADR